MIIELRTLGPRQLAWLREFVPHFAELESAWRKSRTVAAPAEMKHPPANDEGIDP